MPLMWWRSAPAPVTISEQATGVTDGNAETQSRIRVPRSIKAAKFGARSSATASISMSVRSESTTIRHSLRDTDMTRALRAARTRGSPQDAQALVLALGPTAPGGGEPQQGRERNQAEGLEEHRQSGDDQRDHGDDQADRRGASGPRLRSRDHGADDAEGEQSDQDPERHPRPGWMVAVRERDREQDPAADRGADGERDANRP